MPKERGEAGSCPDRCCLYVVQAATNFRALWSPRETVSRENGNHGRTKTNILQGTTMKLKIFVVYHRDIHAELYDEESVNNIVFIGVNKHIKEGYCGGKQHNIIYEEDLPKYDASLQENGYNETSAIHHIYVNRVYQGLDYIGFAQYDMSIKSDVFNKINQTIVNNPSKSYIFYAFKLEMLHLSGGVPYKFILDSYNNHFKTNHTLSEIKSNPFTAHNLVLLSTFVIPVKMFEKIMPWISKLIGELYPWSNLPTWPGKHGHIGCIMERAYGLALALEFLDNNKSTELIPMPIRHCQMHKWITCEFNHRLRLLWGINPRISPKIADLIRQFLDLIRQFLNLTRPVRRVFGLSHRQLRAFKAKLISFLSK